MKLGTYLSLATLVAAPTAASAFLPAPRPRTNVGAATATATSAAVAIDATFENPDTTGIDELACTEAARKMKRISVPVSEEVCPDGSVGISYIHWPPEDGTRRKNCPPLLLIHGFDSSGLEYRRLGPKLAAMGIDAYAVDVLGWGFTQLEGVSTFSASAKVEALEGFVRSVVGGPGNKFCVAGASLGGASAIEFAASKGDDCAGLVLIDAQGFVDGIGPMASLPKPLAKLGVGVLRSVPLRNSANQMSYYDKETFATEEAQVIGRLHCLREGWDDAMVSYMQSGGFYPSEKVPTIEAPTLVLWGRQDKILDGEEFANKFVEEMPNARLRWIEECGHVPHLEQPETTAEAISSFLTTEVAAIDGGDGQGEGDDDDGEPPYLLGAGIVGGAIALSQLAGAVLQ